MSEGAESRRGALLLAAGAIGLVLAAVALAWPAWGAPPERPAQVQRQAPAMTEPPPAVTEQPPVELEQLPIGGGTPGAFAPA
jgi:hypothetical protein